MTGLVVHFATRRSVIWWTFLSVACFAVPVVTWPALPRMSWLNVAGWVVCGLLAAWITRVHLVGWRFVRDHPELVEASRQLVTAVRDLDKAADGTFFRNDTEQVVFRCRRHRLLGVTAWHLNRWTDEDVVDIAAAMENGRAGTLRTETLIVRAGAPVAIIPVVDTVREGVGGEWESAGPPLSFRTRWKTVRMLYGTGLAYATADDLRAVLRQLATAWPIEGEDRS